MNNSPFCTNPEKPYFFLFGLPHRGATLLARILAQAENTSCLCEPSPDLHAECKLLWENRLGDPENALKENISSRLKDGLQNLQYHGEQNNNLAIFARYLVKLFPCRLIFVTGDGRDCVNFLRNGDTSILFGRDTPHPLPGEPCYEQWAGFSRHEKCCWRWNNWNMRILEQLESLPPDLWLKVDYSSSSLREQVLGAAEFLGLKGVLPGKVEEMLAQDVSFAADHIEKAGICATWRNWTDRELEQFWQICSPAMEKLGYYVPETGAFKRWTPDYGQWWQGEETPSDFFESIYQSRHYQHEKFFAWAKANAPEITSVLDVCCGHGLGYASFFAGSDYTGLDLSRKEIEWCKKKYSELNHAWFCEDFMKMKTARKYSLVICQGSIENLYDMDEAINQLCKLSGKYVYLAGCNGFHDQIDEHQYIWNETYKSYSNRFSIKKAQEAFARNNFDCVAIEKIVTGKPENPFESLMIARKKSD